jgi:hypothetical protein
MGGQRTAPGGVRTGLNEYCVYSRAIVSKKERIATCDI